MAEKVDVGLFFLGLVEFGVIGKGIIGVVGVKLGHAKPGNIEIFGWIVGMGIYGETRKNTQHDQIQQPFRHQ